MRKPVLYIILITFVLQLQHCQVLGSLLRNVICGMIECVVDDSKEVFLDFMEQLSMEEQTPTEEETHKIDKDDLLCIISPLKSLFFNFHTSINLTLSNNTVLPSGFYFALIQPPD